MGGGKTRKNTEMNMTPEQKDQWLDACYAMRDGERIQVQLLSGEWADTAIFDPRLPHRRKPKPAPWSLPPPPDGQEWHRTDWTEGDLPEGWRPLLKGEVYQNGDEYKLGSEWRVETNVSSYQTTECCYYPTRTRRPLPTPPRMIAERDDALHKLSRCMHALALIASPRRPDGTYNRNREACELLARETLDATK